MANEFSPSWKAKVKYVYELLTGTVSGVTLTSLSVSTTFAITGVISPSQITSNQNNYNPTGLSTASVLRLSSDAARDITGLATGSSGRIVCIINIGAQNIVLKNQDANSSEANRFLFGGDITLAAEAVSTLRYDGTSSRWRLFA